MFWSINTTLLTLPWVLYYGSVVFKSTSPCQSIYQLHYLQRVSVKTGSWGRRTEIFTPWLIRLIRLSLIIIVPYLLFFFLSYFHLGVSNIVTEKIDLVSMIFQVLIREIVPVKQKDSFDFFVVSFLTKLPNYRTQIFSLGAMTINYSKKCIQCICMQIRIKMYTNKA